eukprot:751523-Hanusia_phi.AAC.2
MGRAFTMPHSEPSPSSPDDVPARAKGETALDDGRDFYCLGGDDFLMTELGSDMIKSWLTSFFQYVGIMSPGETKRELR